ncbi:MAG: FAD:protein FMN transferase [Nitrospirae bacterium]|nr:FAD:protein FMN transferase [Nitrospirota bacterium]MCL5236440.1 FAD:protein FMN transferase [Nitrospirota bacterium]
MLRYLMEGALFSMKKTFIVFIALAICALSSCNPGKESIYKESRITMDTLVTITVSSSSDTVAKAAVDKAFREIDKLGKLLNFFAGDSEVTLINKSAGSMPVTVSKETLDVIERALHVADKTEGAFDISIGPVSSLWDFHTKTMPEEDALKEKLKLVSYKNVVIDRKNSTVFLKKKGMMIDLGGIAKGYAADRAAEVLKNSGIKSGIVAAAGDIRTFGTRPDGSAWNIGIKNPRQTGDDDEILAVIRLSDQAISTSGDYERYFIKNGIRYHHILDPKTGRPAYGCRSVSVITKEGVFTDAFSTGVFVLGPRRGMEILKKMGFDGIIVDSDGNILMTEGIKGKIEVKGNKP